MNLTLHLFNYHCSQCGRIYQGAALPNRYGEFLLRSRSNVEAYLNALEDPAYRAIVDAAMARPLLQDVPARRALEIAQSVFSAVCDKDPENHDFQFSLPPASPCCREANPIKWEATEPPEWIEKELSTISHTAWDRLSDDEQAIALDEALKKKLAFRQRPDFLEFS